MHFLVSSGATTCHRCFPSSPSQCHSQSSRIRLRHPFKRWGGECTRAPCSLANENCVAFGVPSQDPAMAGLEVANYCVSNHMNCCFISACQKAMGMFKVKLCGCSVLAKHDPKRKIRMFLFFEWHSRENWNSLWSAENRHKLVGLSASLWIPHNHI